MMAATLRRVLLSLTAQAVLAAVMLPAARLATAQWAALGPDSRYDLDATVSLEEADSQVATRLERVKSLLAARQWDEAVATLRGVLEDSPERLWPVAPGRFIPVGDYAQQLLTRLPPEALAIYRAQVDPQAERWYRQGVARHDVHLLRRVQREALASRWGDDALLALGEMALESGNAAAARSYWERILPLARPAEAPGGWVSFPETDLDPAAVRARLVLASILEGSPKRARDELAELARLHPAAAGRLGGAEVNYVEALGRLLQESLAWPERAARADWLTFAGNPRRSQIAPIAVDPTRVVWRQPLVDLGPKPSPAAASGPPRTSWPFHPVQLGNLIAVATPRRILALDLVSGRPAWGGTAAVYRDPLEDVPALGRAMIGTPQFTLTIHGRRLLARLGDPTTSRPSDDRSNEPPSYLVCLDLAAEGRLLWKAPTDGPDWSFEGSPLCDGPNVYVSLRRGGIRPQAHVAALDAQTGRRLWIRHVCAAETPGRGLLAETTHNLLTLEHDSLYYNTNLGAIAALDTSDGRILWLSLYPRVRKGDLLSPEPFSRRSLNPCVYHRGLLLVAPCDSRQIFALDAATGLVLWQTPDTAEDVSHLLGVSDEHLIAAGRRLYWIALDRENQGKLTHVWPLGDPPPVSGRGVLAGERVYWPAGDKVYVFDRHSAQWKNTIDLVPKGAAGGNLLVAGGYLLIATERELIALGPVGAGQKESDDSEAF